MSTKRYVIARSQLPSDSPFLLIMLTLFAVDHMSASFKETFGWAMPWWVWWTVYTFAAITWLGSLWEKRQEVEVEMELTPFDGSGGDQPGPGLSGRISGGPKSC